MKIIKHGKLTTCLSQVIIEMKLTTKKTKDRRILVNLVNTSEAMEEISLLG
jgi:hypothetical protein